MPFIGYSKETYGCKHTHFMKGYSIGFQVQFQPSPCMKSFKSFLFLLFSQLWPKGINLVCNVYVHLSIYFSQTHPPIYSEKFHIKDSSTLMLTPRIHIELSLSSSAEFCTGICEGLPSAWGKMGVCRRSIVMLVPVVNVKRSGGTG